MSARWKRRDRELEARARGHYRPRIRKGTGRLSEWEIVAMHGKRPGSMTYYLRRPRKGVTMPYRKVEIE